MLHQAMDVAADYMRAQGGHWEERLLDIPEHFRDAMEFGIHCRAVVALAAAQVRSGHELRHLVGFSEGEGAADHDELFEDFDKAVDAVIAEVPAEEVIREAT
jgi:hypothetical protein